MTIEELHQGVIRLLPYRDKVAQYTPDELREQNYRTSHFGNLETRLQNPTKFPLITLSHK